MNKQNEYRAVVDKIKNLTEERKSVARDAFSEGAKMLFDKHQHLEAFAIPAYTPYFNDGDVCEYFICMDSMRFRFNMVHLHDLKQSHKDGWVRNADVSDGRMWNSELRSFVRYAEPSPLRPCIDDIYDFVKTFDNDTFKDVFGDHVEVIVTRERTELKPYDHE